MGFQARLCIFLLLTCAVMCLARQTPTETGKEFFINDYGGPGHNTKHTPPPRLQSTSLTGATDKFLPPKRG